MTGSLLRWFPGKSVVPSIENWLDKNFLYFSFGTWVVDNQMVVFIFISFLSSYVLMIKLWYAWDHPWCPESELFEQIAFPIKNIFSPLFLPTFSTDKHIFFGTFFKSFSEWIFFRPIFDMWAIFWHLESRPVGEVLGRVLWGSFQT